MEFVFAYLDPGSGSLVIQALIAALVAIPIFFRHQIGRLVRSLRSGGRPDAESTPGPDDPGPKA